jgi:LPS-assembly lipoprotein
MSMRFILTLAICASLSACGFHLRGKLPIPDSINVIAVKSDDKALRRLLVDALSFSGATVVQSEADALALLDLRNVKYDRKVRTIDERGKVTGYILEYRVNFTVTSASGDSLRESTVVTRRDFNFDPDLVLQAEIEEESLRQDMLTDLTQQILRQMATITASIGSPVKVTFQS